MITLRLARGMHDTQMEISDDGAGFDIEDGRKKGGIGLLGMEERAIEMGGEFRVQTQPGQGTRITVVVPLPELGES